MPTVVSRRSVRVYVKASWTDAWQLEPYVEPLRVTLRAAPGVCSATFRYRAGAIKREDLDYFRNDTEKGGIPAEQGFNRWFVKVVLLPLAGGSSEILFLGRFGAEEQDIGGVNGGNLPVDQTFTAYGMELILDRIPIESAWCVNKAGTGTTFSGTAQPFQIDRPLVFNERFGVGLNAFGNRSTTPFNAGGRQSYVFAGKHAGGTAAEPAAWTAYDIVRYLYARYVPSWITIDLGNPTGGATPNVWDAIAGYVMRYDAAGKSVKQVLDELIQRQRGLGWWLRPVRAAGADTAAGETFALAAFTIVNAAVTVDDKTLPANPSQVNVPVHQWWNQQVTYATDNLERYGTIRVIGEPLVACFTVSFADGTLEKAWTTAEEEAYQAVAGADAAAKDAARQAETYAHVYTTYRLPRTWDWKVKNGENAGTAKPVNPLITRATGALSYGDLNAPCRDFGHRLLRTLPLRKQQLQADAEPEFRDLFAVIKGSDHRWHYVDRLPADRVSCLVAPLDTEPGIRLGVNPNHLLALNHWAWTAADTEAERARAVDYTQLAATVAIETDQRLMVELTLDAAEQAVGKVKVIEVPEAALWIVAPGTVIDVNADGTLNHYAAATILRDDGGRLRQVAALAKAFYGIPRAMLGLGVETIYTSLAIGTYINQIIEEPGGSISKPINTVVTELTFDCEHLTTAVQTSFVELDVRMKRRQTNSLARVPVIDAAAVTPAARKAGR